METPEGTRVDWFALPPRYEPRKDGGRAAAIDIRNHYFEEEA